MSRPLHSTPITRASPLLRAGPPADAATVLSASRFPPRGALPLAAPALSAPGQPCQHPPYRGRDRPYGQPPAQIPACATNALGSCLGYERENVRRERDAPRWRVAAIESRGGPSAPS